MRRPFPGISAIFPHFTHISLRRRINYENFYLTSYQSFYYPVSEEFRSSMIEVTRYMKTSFAQLTFEFRVLKFLVLPACQAWPTSRCPRFDFSVSHHYVYYTIVEKVLPQNRNRHEYCCRRSRRGASRFGGFRPQLGWSRPLFPTDKKFRTINPASVLNTSWSCSDLAHTLYLGPLFSPVRDVHENQTDWHSTTNGLRP